MLSVLNYSDSVDTQARIVDIDCEYDGCPYCHLQSGRGGYSCTACGSAPGEIYCLIAAPQSGLLSPGDLRKQTLDYARRFRNGCLVATAVLLVSQTGRDYSLLWTGLGMIASSLFGAWYVANGIAKDRAEGRESLLRHTHGYAPALAQEDEDKAKRLVDFAEQYRSRRIV